MNRLAGEPSAYLRQHAHNPVAWQPFDDAAFAEAVARDVPIFLSVGYAACHWCHVMAGESFEDPAIGAWLNEHFVSIKVDREERPDVDDAYMAATQALSGQGGWPMSVFLTPEGRAFHAGTYFPPTPSSGRPSFKQVLVAVHEAWTERRSQVEETAQSLAAALAKPLWQVSAAPVAQQRTAGSGVEHVSAVDLAVVAGPDLPAAAALAVAAMASAEDSVHGGFGAAPKFPPTPALGFLLRHAATDAPAAAQALGLAGRTLAAMVHSAVFDALGGGFARYSVTADWSEPHYEKMLYDNAGLLQMLVHWVRLAEGSPADGATGMSDAETSPGALSALSVADARDAVHATIAWLLDEMRLEGGAFASSLDADTVIDGLHYEGASYLWTVAQFQAAARQVMGLEVTGDQEAGVQEASARELGAMVARAMGLGGDGTAAGAGAGKPLPLHPGRALTPVERSGWEQLKPALLRMRASRVMPARDDKVVAAWNGMLISAVAEAGMVLEEPTWVRAAVELGEYMHRVHWDGRQLFRVSHRGQARGIKGLLEDYAACANGYLTLYAATGERRWFDFAGQLVESLEQEFIVDGVVYNHGADGSHAAVQGSRFADPFDNATTGAVAMLAQAFGSWAAYTGSTRHRDFVQNILATLPELARRAPRSAGGLLSVAEATLAGPLELAIVGVAGTRRDELVREAWRSGSPGMAIAVWDGIGEPGVPLLDGRALADRPAAGTLDTEKPLAYVCRNMACARPVATPAELAQLLR